MWADENGWSWFFFDCARLVAAVILILNFFLMFADPSGWFMLSCLSLVIVGLFARLPWKRWFGSRDYDA